MSTSLTEAEANDIENQAPEYDPSVPDISVLEDKFPEWFRLPAASAGFTFLIGVTFFFFDRLKPIKHTDVWGHLSYGRHLWETGGLPGTEPLMPLSHGVEFVSFAWLSQLISYAGFLVVGKAAIPFLFAVAIAAALGILTRRIYSRTHSAMFATGAFALTLWIEFQQFTVQRPQVAGFLFFSIVLAMLLRREWSPKYWWMIPGLFAFWANMHGSFAVGLGLMGCFTIGRAVDLLRRTGRPGILVRDNRLRRLFLLTELSAAATLLNPYGLTLWTEVLSFGGNPNLRSILEWQPLHIQMYQGQAAAFATLALFLIYRVSPRRVTTAEVLSLAVFGGAALWTSRMLLWWGPLAGCFAALHAGAAWRNWKGQDMAPEPAERASLWTVVALGIGFIFFELSHMGSVTLAFAVGKDIEKVTANVPVSKQTPVAAAEYLKEHPPTGLIFNPFEWGDYLLWAGPENLQVFVASHCHLIPEEVWDDYMGIIRMGSGWDTMLKRYGVNTVILNEEEQSAIVRNLREDKEWRLVFLQDGQAIFKRVDPITIKS